MSIASRIARLLRSLAPGGTTRRGAITAASFNTGGDPMTVAAVYRCVQLLSNSVASLPVQVLRRRGDVFNCDTGSRLHYLLNVQPDEGMSAFDFWRRVVQLVLLDGNAYIMPLPDAGGAISRMVLCNRGTVAHDTVNDRYTISDLASGVSGTYDESEIIHIKGTTLHDAKHGLGVIAFARQTIDIATQSGNETLDRFRNGGSVRGIVSNDKSGAVFGQYKKDELDNTAATIDDQLRGGTRIVSLPGDVHFSQLTMSAADMQFLESRRFTVREVCRFFGVHPSFVFDDTSNNYKSAEQASTVFLTYALNPLLRAIEGEFQRKLVPESAVARLRFSFDRRGLYACDLDSRMRYVSQTISTGLYSINDWRREENRPPVEGGDTLFVSANLRTIKEYISSQNTINETTTEEN